VTWTIEAGTPAKRVGEWVGASLGVLERYYAHVAPAGAVELGFPERIGRLADGERAAQARQRLAEASARLTRLRARVQAARLGISYRRFVGNPGQSVRAWGEERRLRIFQTPSQMSIFGDPPRG
jgi:hypothetical protein